LKNLDFLGAALVLLVGARAGQPSDVAIAGSAGLSKSPRE